MNLFFFLKIKKRKFLFYVYFICNLKFTAVSLLYCISNLNKNYNNIESIIYSDFIQN